MRRYYTNPDSRITIVLEGTTVTGTMAGVTWQRFNRQDGTHWLRTDNDGRELPAPGLVPEQLEADYATACQYAVPVRAEHRRNLRSAMFAVAELDGITARDVARELAGMFGWRVTDDVLTDPEVRAAALELGIDLAPPSEDNSPGATREQLEAWADRGDTMAARELEQADAAERITAEHQQAAEAIQARSADLLAPAGDLVRAELAGDVTPGPTAVGTIERVTAADVAPGDYVARVKRGPYARVATASWGASAVWLAFDHAPRIRPHRSAKLWRFVPAEVQA